ncbi:universal stress protein [Niveibacterium terrae]|uniref:universal stress protein n=1 Tax=Niveibacterium terrae TaxID=3373598 RepID=UPI003A904753
MFKHLLVPTDGSELSLAAVQHAVSFASDAGAHITFLYIEQPFPAPYIGEGAIMDENAPATFHEQADIKAQQALVQAEYIARGSNVECSTLATICKSPYEAIIDAAKRNSCDLIFMASHGRVGLERLLTSSTTEKVLIHADIPVLVHR